MIASGGTLPGISIFRVPRDKKEKQLIYEKSRIIKNGKGF